VSTVEPNLSTTQKHRARLARLLVPQNVGEHRLIDYLSVITKLQHPTLVGMIERRLTTTARAARMHVAQLALDQWAPDVGSPPDAVTTMEHLASGGDPSTGVVPEHEDVRTAVSLAYDRGFAEGWDEAVARCRREQLAGRDPEVWRVERPGGKHR
jgi:hypothetical protein